MEKTNDPKIICCLGCATPGQPHTCGQQAVYKHRPDYHQWTNDRVDDHTRQVQKCPVCNCTRTLNTDGVTVLYYERNNIPFPSNKMPLCQK